MKNKLEKKHLTKFDYISRRLGVIGLALIVLSCAVLLPISKSISSHNVALNKEIDNIAQNIEDETNKTNTILERK